MNDEELYFDEDKDWAIVDIWKDIQCNNEPTEDHYLDHLDDGDYVDGEE